MLRTTQPGEPLSLFATDRPSSPALARLTGESYRVIHARVSRETGAASVAAASAAQLEQGNRLLEREAGRRR